MLFGQKILHTYFISSSYVRNKTATTWHFGYCVKSKFAVCLSANGVILHQPTCQNMSMEKVGA